MVLCYQSLLSNPEILTNLKFHQQFYYKPGTAPAICQNCIDVGQCVDSVDGKKLKWNAIRMYYYHLEQILEVELDFDGNRFNYFNLNLLKLLFYNFNKLKKNFKLRE
jgi:hypothetical protein